MKEREHFLFLNRLYWCNFRTILAKYGSIHSNSRKRNPYDNAVMESFYRTIKRELIQDAHFATPEQAQKEIFKYIELYTIIRKEYISH